MDFQIAFTNKEITPWGGIALMKNQWFFKGLQFENYTLDVDSSVSTPNGDQEWAILGYNPKKTVQEIISSADGVCCGFIVKNR